MDEPQQKQKKNRNCHVRILKTLLLLKLLEGELLINCLININKYGKSSELKPYAFNLNKSNLIFHFDFV